MQGTATGTVTAGNREVDGRGHLHQPDHERWPSLPEVQQPSDRERCAHARLVARRKWRAYTTADPVLVDPHTVN